MTATRYASIALSGPVVACGNIIFKPSETTPNNLIGRCREKSLLICIGFNISQLLSVASPKTVVYVTMAWLPLKCMEFKYRVAHNGVMGFHRKKYARHRGKIRSTRAKINSSEVNRQRYSHHWVLDSQPHETSE